MVASQSLLVHPLPLVVIADHINRLRAQRQYTKGQSSDLLVAYGLVFGTCQEKQGSLMEITMCIELSSIYATQADVQRRVSDFMPVALVSAGETTKCLGLYATAYLEADHAQLQKIMSDMEFQVLLLHEEGKSIRAMSYPDKVSMQVDIKSSHHENIAVQSLLQETKSSGESQEVTKLNEYIAALSILEQEIQTVLSYIESKGRQDVLTGDERKIARDINALACRLQVASGEKKSGWNENLVTAKLGALTNSYGSLKALVDTLQQAGQNYKVS